MIGGLDHSNSSGSGEKWSDSGCILKVQLTRLADRLEAVCQRLLQGFWSEYLKEWSYQFLRVVRR